MELTQNVSWMKEVETEWNHNNKMKLLEWTRQFQLSLLKLWRWRPKQEAQKAVIAQWIDPAPGWSKFLKEEKSISLIFLRKSPA